MACYSMLLGISRNLFIYKSLLCRLGKNLILKAAATTWEKGSVKETHSTSFHEPVGWSSDCHQTEYITWRSFCCCWGYRRLGRFGELALTHLISSAPRSVRGWAKDCVRTEPKNCPHQLRDSQKLTSFRSFWLWENLFCGSVAPDLLEHSFPKNPARLPSTFFFQFWEAIPATKSRRGNGFARPT